ncbi:uncharacterized protein CANTADRAFT_133253 [Suhomyces tanzawaensis NRRL Y-17324]|uniref:Vacuolar membrane protein n=1 Tax=Suhomyces tanzawaensis NRRL Y-17324 TaxID=984487 RepID=A0A1E4SRE4_9ASCO|nr:uncharacterized protein CANTADRAFT_133253 [Suhomyces tanzawaensis NRRL Y-17324]ODV82068.1 hypothetical protein CANTADRAFT_133253 [Suhomyces tanzawaensis NRRL Y-17324]
MAIDLNHFSAQQQIQKYKLNESTFDIIDVDSFHNVRAKTVLAYLWEWFLMILSWVLLGTDIYTCLSILVFHHWSSKEYQPYEYSVAKWIFTGCIIFEFCLLLYHWIWAIHTYRTRNIALNYVNSIAKNMYTVRSYNYFCLFHLIERVDHFDWSCFYCLEQMDQALQILIADAPRQVINFLTLRYYATGGEKDNNILGNIEHIATTNLTLSIILSFMCVSVVIFAFFFLKFLYGVILFLPIKSKLRKKGHKSLKKYCCKVVNDTVKMLVIKHHKSKRELLDKGILDTKDIEMNPLLNSSTTTFKNMSSDNLSSNSDPVKFSHNLKKPAPAHNLTNKSTFAYNDNGKLYGLVNGDNGSHETLVRYDGGHNPFADPMESHGKRSESLSSLTHPGNDPSTSAISVAGNRNIHRKNPPPFNNPFVNENSPQTSLVDQNTSYNPFEASSYNDLYKSTLSASNHHNRNPGPPPRSGSQSSLSYGPMPFSQQKVTPSHTMPERALHHASSKSSLVSHSRPHNLPRSATAHDHQKRKAPEPIYEQDDSQVYSSSQHGHYEPQRPYEFQEYAPNAEYARQSNESAHIERNHSTSSEGSVNYNNNNESTTGLLIDNFNSPHATRKYLEPESNLSVPYPMHDTRNDTENTPYPVRGVSVYEEDFSFNDDSANRYRNRHS